MFRSLVGWSFFERTIGHKKSQHPLECCDYELLDKWEFIEEFALLKNT